MTQGAAAEEEDRGFRGMCHIWAQVEAWVESNGGVSVVLGDLGGGVESTQGRVYSCYLGSWPTKFKSVLPL